jgi:rhamnose utilization protein RhaD (predicted bifunctional aldolase and dehydrogenase)
LGLIVLDKNKGETRVTAEFYLQTIEVMHAAEAISQYQGLPRQELRHRILGFGRSQIKKVGH